MRSLVSLVVVGLALAASAVEEHVDRVVDEILANVAKLKAVDPSVAPMAFWDFDGTIIRGDISVGLQEDGVERHQGMIHAGIMAGFSPFYKGEEGCRQFDRDYARLNEIGRFIAWPFIGQAFSGVKVADFDRFCAKRVRDVYSKWYFASSVAILRRLEAAGVENHIISGSPDIFVRSAAESIGLTPDRMHGVRLAIDGGVLSTRIEYPVTTGEGKIEVLRRLVNARKNAVAVAGFGDSYRTDGAFLRYIVRQTLPGGARGFALMINGSGSASGYEGLFTCVRQSEIVGK